MSLSRREFLQIMAIASAAGVIRPAGAAAKKMPGDIYEVPTYGNVTLLHFTDTHAQLMPIYFREPDTNIGVGQARGKPPHLVGKAFLEHFKIRPNSIHSHAYTPIDFVEGARKYGKVGGFAHLATLVKRYRGESPKRTLLLDGGDTWQGSGTALWTKGLDMVQACNQLGVDSMVGHWEFTLGQDRVKELVEKEAKFDFLAQNIKDNEFGDPVFKPYAIKEVNGFRVAVIGQAFPFTPIANPRYLIPDWSFGIQDQNMQAMVDKVRNDEKADVVVVLSHNGMDVDLKMAERVKGIDVILGGHTHDAVPQPSIVGKTLVVNSGSNGKFLSRLDLDVAKGRVKGYKFTMLPIFSNLIKPDAEMAQLIEKIRAPYQDKLNEKLAVSEDLLYRRGNFNGTFDQLIVQALMDMKNAEAAFSPGFRWGTTVLPGQPITFEHVMDQTALTYPVVTLNEFTGAQIKEIMEDVADNLFNPDPYYQQGGDMVRVGGIEYTMDPTKTIGNRIQNLHIRGKAVEADKKYKVAGWASVGQPLEGEPIWDLVAKWLREQKTVKVSKLNRPRLIGVENNPGIMG
ncbi:thiosulfohydrolase SoxB [Thermithiobacillus tepidarius DSM 3134]|uniref:thiosulfohydrolase SoxB n=1 Tax=Thermithiobacillus tepidarius TaxID=929 RepID=UPI00042311CE|nr:thiosulfohydrolase SoxB [Thermithiobacillus tepidarius]